MLTVVIALVCSLLYSLYCPSKWSTCLRFLLVSLNKKVLEKKVKTEISSNQTLLLSSFFLISKIKLKTQVLSKGSTHSKSYSSNRNLKWYSTAKGRKMKKKERNKTKCYRFSTTVSPQFQTKSFFKFQTFCRKIFLIQRP